MGKVNVLVLRAAGINCDEEVMHAWQLAGAEPTSMHVARLAERPGLLDYFQIVTIPGGFSYGDDIGAGTILAQRVMQDLAEPLQRLVDRGGGIFGICNGFQVLVKAGLLPGSPLGHDQVTVTYNDSAKFEARWVRLQVCTDRCPFLGEGTKPSLRPRPALPASSLTRGAASPPIPARRDRNTERPPRVKDDQNAEHSRRVKDHEATKVLEMPVEHAEGKVVTANQGVLEELERRGQIALRYVDESGRFDTYPANPNGSMGGIAGLCDETGRVFGLMPHPDRHLDPTQHPLWTRREGQLARPDGLSVFLNAVDYWSKTNNRAFGGGQSEMPTTSTPTTPGTTW